MTAWLVFISVVAHFCASFSSVDEDEEDALDKLGYYDDETTYSTVNTNWNMLYIQLTLYMATQRTCASSLVHVVEQSLRFVIVELRAGFNSVLMKPGRCADFIT